LVDEAGGTGSPSIDPLAAGAAGIATPVGPGLLQSTRTVTLLGILAQVAAFARTAIIAAALGASLDVDAYNLGLIAPAFISTVVGGWLQVGFLGRYAALVATGNESLAAAYRTRMLFLVGAGALALAGLCFLVPDQIMGILVPVGQPEMLAASTGALRLAGWILLPTIVGDFLGIVLNSHRRFLAAALAPLVNGLVSAAALSLWPTANLSALVWTLLLGTFVQLLVVFLALRGLRLRYPLDNRIAAPEVRATLLIGLPLLPAMMLSNSAAAIIQVRAANFGEGSISLYGYASRLHVAVTQILVIGLSTVLLPHFAALWARGEKGEIVMLFRRLARVGVLVTSFLTVGIALMGDTAVGTLLGRGRFDAEQVRQVGALWSVLSFSLFPLAFGTYIAKLAQAMRRGGAILVSSAIGFAAVWTTTYLGAAIGSLHLVVGGLVVSPIFVTCFWLVWMSRYMPISPVLRDLAGASLRVLIVMLPAIGVDLLLRRYTDELPDVARASIRGATYTITVALALIGTRGHIWFLAPPRVAA
jgi:putative peptidoglycan lipid II flippase